ncbi:MAG TPA: hypothetical protein VG757_01625 [Devosia sp.]|nr:hypothetical protein [Devosia sp.]
MAPASRHRVTAPMASEERYHGNRIRSALQTYFWLRMAALALAFVCQIVIVKCLAPDQYATYAILLALIIAGERTLSFGVDRAVTRFVPKLTEEGNLPAIDAVIRRTLLIRLAGLAILLVLCLVAMGVGATGWLPVPLDNWILLPFAIWFVATALLFDADAYAQSWLAHGDSARSTLAEVILRLVATVLCLALVGQLTATELVWISMATQSLATGFLVYRLIRLRIHLRAEATGLNSEAAPFDPTIVPGFAFANFASTLMYLVSSPPVIRIVASSGLSVVALAAYSFVQTLALSVQRLLPGMSILPSLEPFAMAGVAGDRRAEVLAALSLVFKLELIAILAGTIVATLFGHDLILLLSRPEYAGYYFVLPLLLVYVSFATAYRLVEIVLNAHLRHRTFFWVWPLGLLSTLAIAVTVDRWGIWSVLLIPIAEILLRVAGLSVVFRRLNLGRVFDLRHTLPVMAMAAVLIGALLWMRGPLGGGTLVDLGLAIAGTIAFLAGLTVLKPLALQETGWLEHSVPKALKFALAPMRFVTQPLGAG